MTPPLRWSTAVTLAVILCGATTSPGQDRPVERSIEAVRGNLYVARFGTRATVFAVTSEGVVVSDPISSTAARWLKDEIESRFPGRNVRFVLHTHHHFDRAAGAAVFGQEAVTVGHREFNRRLERAKGSSSYSDVRPVTRTYLGRTSVELGNTTIEMLEAGGGHAWDMSLIYFPGERTVFAVEHPAFDRVPLSFGDFSPPEFQAWVNAVLSLDADTLVSGDGRILPLAPLRDVQSYVDELIATVTNGMLAGRSGNGVLAMSQRVQPSSPHASARDAHARHVLKHARLRATTIAGFGGIGVAGKSTSYCDEHPTCSGLGGQVPVGGASISHSVGAFSLVGEVSFGGQLYATRARPFFEESVANRRSQVSILARRPVGGTSTIRLDLLAGATMTRSDTRGLDRVSGTLTPIGGRHPIADLTTSPGVTVGADVVLGVSRRLALVLPVRGTWIAWNSTAARNPGPVDVRASVALAVTVGSRVSFTEGRHDVVVAPGARSQ